MPRRHGYTLIEILIALTLLLLFLGLAYRGVLSFMHVREQQDAIAATQAKLRRVLEVLTQDLRGSVLGAITDEPYPSNDQAVSFALLKGSSGFKVYTDNPATWSDAYKTWILAEDPDLQPGDRVLLVNQEKKAVLLTVSGIRPLATHRWAIEHATCRNTLTYRSNTLLFGIKLYGIRYDEAHKTLVLNEDGDEAPLAFGISDFTIQYLPDRTDPERLRVTVAAQKHLRGRVFERRYVGLVELNHNATFAIEEVVPCVR